jgi:hypothetical protein
MLSARSDYFRAMFEKPSWKESSSESIQVPRILSPLSSFSLYCPPFTPYPCIFVFDFAEMAYRTFVAVMVYIYTGEIDQPISTEDTQLLLAAANKYILPRLKHLCETALVNVLTADNVFCILYYYFFFFIFYIFLIFLIFQQYSAMQTCTCHHSCTKLACSLSQTTCTIRGIRRN